MLPARVGEALRAGRIVEGHAEHDGGAVVEGLHSIDVQRLAIDAYLVQSTLKEFASSAICVGCASHVEGLCRSAGRFPGEDRRVRIHRRAIDVQFKRAAVEDERHVIPGILGQDIAALVGPGPGVVGVKAEAQRAALALELYSPVEDGLAHTLAPAPGMDPGRDAEATRAQVEAGVRSHGQAVSALEARSPADHAIHARGAMGLARAIVAEAAVIGPAGVLIEAQGQDGFAEEGAHRLLAHAGIVDARVVELAGEVRDAIDPAVTEGDVAGVGGRISAGAPGDIGAIDVEPLSLQPCAEGMHDVMPLVVVVGVLGARILRRAAGVYPGAHLALRQIKLRALAVLDRGQPAIRLVRFKPERHRVILFGRIEVSADVAAVQAQRSAVTALLLVQEAAIAHALPIVGRDVAGAVLVGLGRRRGLVLEGEPELRLAGDRAPI